MTQAWAGTRGSSDDGTRRTTASAGGLVGRDAELALLDDLLSRSDVRIVTIAGLAGVGKSRLAAEALERLADGGRPVMRVDLSGVHDARLLGDAVAASGPGTDLGGLVPGAADALWERFGGEPVVLLLDHLDEVEAPDAAIAGLLEGYPLLQVLATSIRPLRVPGEHVLRLTPLPSSDDATTDPGVALFLARASVADAAFDAAGADLDAVVQVVRACGGLPLAIELAAARVAAVPPAAMARQLEAASAAEVLRDASPDATDRRRSVAAALGWTVGLLSPGARQTLEEASVFEGSVGLDALASVSQAVPAPAELLDRVAELVDVQLVALDTSDAGSIAVRLSPLVRAFALARLRAAGREVAVRDAHAEHFRAACAADPSVVRRAFPDVLAALDHGVLHGRSLEALSTAVLAAAEAGDLPGAEATLLSRLGPLLAEDTGEDPGLRIRALLWEASHTPADSAALTVHGEWTRGRIAEAVALARSTGDQRGLLEALEMTVRTLGLTLDLMGAVAAAHEGLRLAAQLGDEQAVGRFEVYNAMAAGSGGDMARATELAESALDRATRFDDPATIGYAATLLRLSPVKGTRDIPPLGELVRRCEEDGQPFAVLHLLAAMTLDALAAGDLAQAARLIHRQLVVAADHGRSLPFGGIAALAALVQVALLRGSFEDGVRLAEGLVPTEPLLVTSTPTFVEPYRQARAALAASVAPERFAELTSEVAGLPLPGLLRLAIPMARDWSRQADGTVPSASTVPTVPTVPEPRSDRQEAAAAHLTPREREVLLEMSRGGTNADIADRLGLSTKTVMHHSVAIYRKLGVRSRTEATAWAFRTGLAADDAGR